MSRTLFSLGVALALAGCSSSPPATDGAPTSAPSATSIATLLPGGLVPRPGLPPLENGEAAGCLPQCEGGRLTRPGALPIGEPYQTVWFFGGYMTLTFDTAWIGIEDSTGELKVAPAPDPEYGVGIALDLYPVDRGIRVPDVPNTGEAMLEWLRSNPRLVVSEPSNVAIGSLPATSVDIRLAPDATTDSPDCPATCVDFLGYHEWNHANGILGDDVYGFIVADVEYGGADHVLSLTIEGRDAAHLGTMLRLLEPILPTITVPASAS